MKPALSRLLTLLLCLLLLPVAALMEDEVSLFGGDAPASTVSPSVPDAETETPPAAESLPAVETPGSAADPAARDAFIDDMIALAQSLYQKANGRAQKASSAGDIYVCKNFTVHLFRENRSDYRLAEFPEVELRIPNNLPAKESKPYTYGIAWEEVAPEQGNPFYAAHSFYYDSELSAAQNREKAMAFMREVKRGDFFQMSAKYYYGVGAHSAVFISDYDPATNEVAWTDSNMKGESRNGVRYGYVQYDARKDIGWFVDAFCQKGRGATLYRLRDDIIKR